MNTLTSAGSAGSYEATVVITTKNRKGELRQAIQSALAQTANVEVLVVDDGSTDGTPEMVRTEFPQTEFPQVVLHRVEESQGLIVQRNRAAHLASAPIIVSIDDDAVFSSPHTVSQTLAEFSDDSIGAVAIPYIDVCKSRAIQQMAPRAGSPFVAYSYIGTAHAVRRDLFLRLHGYRSYLFHQGEERDYCIRLLDQGYVTRLGRAAPVHHFESPHRDFRRMAIYGWRNNVLYAWYNIPAPDCLLAFVVVCYRAFLFGLQSKNSRLRHVMWGIAQGYGACLHEWRKRKPVSRRAYMLSRRLGKSGGVPLQEIKGDLAVLTRAKEGRA